MYLIWTAAMNESIDANYYLVWNPAKICEKQGFSIWSPCKKNKTLESEVDSCSNNQIFINIVIDHKYLPIH